MYQLKNISNAGGKACIAVLPSELQIDLGELDPGTVEFIVYEDGEPLGPLTQIHDEIRKLGNGRYCPWGKEIYLSSSDGTNPQSNGRTYSAALGEPLVIERAMQFVKPNLTVETAGMVRETLRNVIRCGGLVALEEVRSVCDIKGKDVLEVGAGACWIAPFFLAEGAKSYHGVEVGDYTSEQRIFNRSFSNELWTDDHYVPMPLSLGEFLEAFDSVSFDVEDFSRTSYAEGQFDLVFLRVVSEHLLKFRASLKEMHRIMKTGGKIYLSHGSYHSWNGHHVAPHTVAEINTDSDEQLQVIDWNHLRVLVDNERSDHHNLNYVRLHELFDVLRSHFTIIDWWTTPSDDEHGGGRLSDQIRDGLPQYYREEMTMEMAFVVARKDGAGSAFYGASTEGNEQSVALVASILNEQLERVAYWLENGGDILDLSRTTGLSAAHLVEVRQQYIELQKDNVGF